MINPGYLKELRKNIFTARFFVTSSYQHMTYLLGIRDLDTETYKVHYLVLSHLFLFLSNFTRVWNLMTYNLKIKNKRKLAPQSG